MIMECRCCLQAVYWLSGELPLSIQLKNAVRTPLHMHLDTDDPLVVAHFGRIIQTQGKFSIPLRTISKSQSGQISRFL